MLSIMSNMANNGLLKDFMSSNLSPFLQQRIQNDNEKEAMGKLQGVLTGNTRMINPTLTEDENDLYKMGLAKGKYKSDMPYNEAFNILKNEKIRLKDLETATKEGTPNFYNLMSKVDIAGIMPKLHSTQKILSPEELDAKYNAMLNGLMGDGLYKYVDPNALSMINGQLSGLKQSSLEQNLTPEEREQLDFMKAGMPFNAKYRTVGEKDNNIRNDKIFNRGIVEADRSFNQGVTESDRNYGLNVDKNNTDKQQWNAQFDYNKSRDADSNARQAKFDAIALKDAELDKYIESKTAWNKVTNKFETVAIYRSAKTGEIYYRNVVDPSVDPDKTLSSDDISTKLKKSESLANGKQEDTDFSPSDYRINKNTPTYNQIGNLLGTNSPLYREMGLDTGRYTFTLDNVNRAINTINYSTTIKSQREKNIAINALKEIRKGLPPEELSVAAGLNNSLNPPKPKLETLVVNPKVESVKVQPVTKKINDFTSVPIVSLFKAQPNVLNTKSKTQYNNPYSEENLFNNSLRNLFGSENPYSKDTPIGDNAPIIEYIGKLLGTESGTYKKLGIGTDDLNLSPENLDLARSKILKSVVIPNIKKKYALELIDDLAQYKPNKVNPIQNDKMNYLLEMLKSVGIDPRNLNSENAKLANLMFQNQYAGGE